MEATEFLLTFILLLINYVPTWIASEHINKESSIEDKVFLFFSTFFYCMKDLSDKLLEAKNNESK